MMSFCLTICALSMVLGDLAASFILPNVPGQQWVKVGYLNMSDPTQQCPYPWQTVTSPVASCEKRASVICDSVNIITTSGASYEMVCGRFLGYQIGSPDGFYSLTSSLETHYVDGVSITYGSPGNRQHVYTYAAGWNEYRSANTCPCAAGTSPPAFAGSDYYCESGNNETTWVGTMHVLQRGRTVGWTACCVVMTRLHVRAAIHQTSRGSAGILHIPSLRTWKLGYVWMKVQTTKMWPSSSSNCIY